MQIKLNTHYYSETLLSKVKVMPNYLELVNTPKENFSFRLTDEIVNKVDRFQHSSTNRTEKITYLIRLVDAVKPTIAIEPKHHLPKPRTHLSGSYLPEDVVDIIRAASAEHNLKLVSTMDLYISKGLELSKKYNLVVKLEAI